MKEEERRVGTKDFFKLWLWVKYCFGADHDDILNQETSHETTVGTMFSL